MASLLLVAMPFVNVKKGNVKEIGVPLRLG